VASEGRDYGRWDFGQGKRMNVEFVSANPVGGAPARRSRALGRPRRCPVQPPGHGGYAVDREFYLNDFGTPDGVFAASVEARYSSSPGRRWSSRRGISRRLRDRHRRALLEEDGGRCTDSLRGAPLLDSMRMACRCNAHRQTHRKGYPSHQVRNARAGPRRPGHRFRGGAAGRIASEPAGRGRRYWRVAEGDGVPVASGARKQAVGQPRVSYAVPTAVSSRRRPLASSSRRKPSPSSSRRKPGSSSGSQRKR